MITALREALDQAAKAKWLDPAAQEAFANTLRHIIALANSDTHKDFLPAQEARASLEKLLDVLAHPVFTDEVEWMKHLGMSDEDIAWVMAQPTEPEPGEAYLDADS